MIYNLCNLFDEKNLDTFFQISIIEATQLPPFNHLMPKADILAILNSMPDTYQVMHVPLLPEKLDLSHGTERDDNLTYGTGISFPLLPQDAAIKELLETYNKRNVVALLQRNNHSYLYGTSEQPLEFTFSEIHANTNGGLKGFALELRGEGYGSAVYFSEAEIAENPIVQGLAFQLAGTL